MQTSAAGRSAIERRERCVLTAYRDSGGTWTVGCGHTSAIGDPFVYSGLTITAAQADAILARDLAVTETAVNEAVKVDLNQNQFDALVSLAFNIGAGAFAKSTLVRKLNAGDVAGAADQFLVWNKDRGKIVQGLVNRRKDERKQFLAASPSIDAQKTAGVPKAPVLPSAPAKPTGGFWAWLFSFIANLFSKGLP